MRRHLADDQRLMELCEAASKEMDGERLMTLIRGISELISGDPPKKKPQPAFFADDLSGEIGGGVPVSSHSVEDS